MCQFLKAYMGADNLKIILKQQTKACIQLGTCMCYNFYQSRDNYWNNKLKVRKMFGKTKT